jgi:MFS family permease
MFSSYLAITRLSGAKSLLFLSFLTRAINIPLGALFTVVVYEITKSWSEAALAGGIVAGTAALSVWLSGKAMDIFSPRAVLLAFLPGSLLPLLFLLEPGGAALFFLAALAGLTRPPSGTTIRTSWQRIARDEKERMTAYALDASLAPVAGSLGAALGGVLFIVFSAFGVICFLVIIATISTLLLALHKSSEEKGGRKKASERKGATSLERMPLSVWLAILSAALSWGALVGLEILVGARFGAEILLFFNAAGALLVALGALVSARLSDRSGLNGLAGAAAAASASLMLLLPGFFIYAPLIIPAAALFALTRGIISVTATTHLSIASPIERRSEALALYGSGVLLGQASSRPLAGLLLGLAPAAILLLPAALFSLLAFRLKELRKEILLAKAESQKEN